MNPGLVHSELCLVGTSHNVPQDCKGANFQAIVYPAPDPEPEIGHSEPKTNSEEGQRALAADGGENTALEPNPDPEGHSDVIHGAPVPYDRSDAPPATEAP